MRTYAKNSDKDVILKHLKRHKSIREGYALFDLGIKRLSARISEMKEHGYNIKTILKKVEKRNGRIVNVTDKYVLSGF